MSTLTTYPELEQRSPEWVQARCGIVTASTVGLLITKRGMVAGEVDCPKCGSPADVTCTGVKGQDLKQPHDERKAAAKDDPRTVIAPADNDTSRGLIATLAAQRITGRVEDGPMSAAMWRGAEDEPFARDAYERTYAPVQEMGFMVRDYGHFRLGYSPDGLVGDNGAIEIKSRNQKAQVLTFLADEIPAENMAQLQCALLVTGRDWIDYVAFRDGMPLYRKRVTPDDRWHTAILTATKQAEEAITTITERYQEATNGLPLTELIPDLTDITF